MRAIRLFCRMAIKRPGFPSPTWMIVTGWVCAALIVAINLKLLGDWLWDS